MASLPARVVPPCAQGCLDATLSQTRVQTLGKKPIRCPGNFNSQLFHTQEDICGFFRPFALIFLKHEGTFQLHHQLFFSSQSHKKLLFKKLKANSLLFICLEALRHHSFLKALPEMERLPSPRADAPPHRSPWSSALTTRRVGF